MYNVSIIGKTRTGKSSLRSQWSGQSFSESYCSTIFVEVHQMDSMVMYEIPNPCREPVVQYYEHTDVFVLVVRKDATRHDAYERLCRLYRDASWLMVFNGPGEFPKSRLYATNRGLSMARVNLKTGMGVTESLRVLQELTQLHRQRPMPVSLLDEVYQWIPACV